MDNKGKWYISFGCTLWDKRVVDLLNILRSKTKYMLCGVPDDVNEAMIEDICFDKKPVFIGNNSTAFITEMYRYWNQPTESLNFNWYLSELSPDSLIRLCDNFLFTDNLDDIDDITMSVSVVEYGDFAVCVKDYKGEFLSTLDKLSHLFEGENQFTEYKEGYIGYI